MIYKLKKYPLTIPFEDALLLDYADTYEGYEAVGISITGWFNKALWVLYKKKSELGENSDE